MKGWNGVGLQLTRPTVLLNEIIAFSWHLFTNSCTQNLLAHRASGESVFGCPTENLLVPGNQMGGNFEPCYVTAQHNGNNVEHWPQPRRTDGQRQQWMAGQRAPVAGSSTAAHWSVCSATGSLCTYRKSLLLSFVYPLFAYLKVHFSKLVFRMIVNIHLSPEWSDFRVFVSLIAEVYNFLL